MEFALVLVIVLLIIVLIVLFAFKAESKRNTVTLNKHVVAVYKRVKALEESIDAGEVRPTQPKIIQPEAVVEKPIKAPEIKKETVKPEELKKPLIEEKVIEPIKPFEVKPTPIVSQEPKKVVETSTKPTPVIKPKRDFEKQIGENLLNKIGIAILVIGIGFFVKYAIDRNWIGEIGRVAIGVGIGSILIAIAHFMRKNYKAFSSVLIGGGIAIFYYTISIAYHDYHIFTQPVAFGIMTLVTIVSVILSVLYDKKEIAIIGIIGGFTSPFMVAGETENYVAFFTYLAILNSGMLALSFFKKWNIINKLAYGFTILFFGAWVIIHISDNDLPTQFALVMGSVFYIQFLLVSLWYNISHKLKFNALEFIQILSINALYFLAGVFILMDVQNGDYQGLFTIVLAIFNFTLYFALKAIKSADVSLPPLFLAKAVSFVTLAILLQFDAHYATLFWSLEAIVILWIGQQSKQQVLKHASVLVNIIATFGLIYSWFKQYNDFDSSVIFDAGLVSNLGIVLTYVVSLFLLSREEEDADFFSIPSKFYRNTLAFWAYIAFYITVLIKLIIILDGFTLVQSTPDEISIYHEYLKNNSFNHLVLWTYNILMVAIGLTFCKFKKVPLFTEGFTILSVLSILSYLVIGNLNTVSLRKLVLTNNLSIGYFLTHFLLVGLIILMFLVLRKVSFQISENKGFHKWMLVVLSVFGVALASMELDHITVSLFYKQGVAGINNVLVHTQREGYSILWGIYSFILMIYGMRKKNPHMRILSLVLFGITLLKLFILDIRGMSDAGKIVAFISLGVLLLVVSFLYQKLRKIIVDGEIK